MKRIQLVFAVLAAIIGVGAAYASQPKTSANNIVYRWYTAHGTFIFIAQMVVAEVRCYHGINMTCLIGTIEGAPPVLIQGTFQ